MTLYHMIIQMKKRDKKEGTIWTFQTIKIHK